MKAPPNRTKSFVILNDRLDGLLSSEPLLTGIQPRDQSKYCKGLIKLQLKVDHRIMSDSTWSYQTKSLGRTRIWWPDRSNRSAIFWSDIGPFWKWKINCSPCYTHNCLHNTPFELSALQNHSLSGQQLQLRFLIPEGVRLRELLL